MAGKVAAIRTQAVAWSQIRATLTGIRSRAFEEIEAAQDSAGVDAALQAALAEVSTLTFGPA